MSDEPSPSGLAGDAYGELIADYLRRQDARKASLEQRGLAVISTSATLVTLQFALVAVIIRGDSFVLTAIERIALGCALALLVGAAVLGLLTNITRTYEGVSTRQLERLTRKNSWSGSHSEATRRIAMAQVRILRTARSRNAAKAKLLRYAIVTEVAAVCALAMCVTSILA